MWITVLNLVNLKVVKRYEDCEEIRSKFGPLVFRLLRGVSLKVIESATDRSGYF